MSDLNPEAEKSSFREVMLEYAKLVAHVLQSKNHTEEQHKRDVEELLARHGWTMEEFDDRCGS